MQPSSHLPINIKSRAIDQFVQSTAASFGHASQAGRKPHALLIQAEDRAELSGFVHQLLCTVGIDAPMRMISDEGEAELRFFDTHPDPLVIDKVETFSNPLKRKLATAYANPRHVRPPLVLFLVKKPLTQLMDEGLLDSSLAMRLNGTLVWPRTSERVRDRIPLFQAFVIRASSRTGKNVDIDPKAYEHLNGHWKSQAPQSVHEIRQLAERALVAAKDGRITQTSMRIALEVPAVLISAE